MQRTTSRDLSVWRDMAIAGAAALFSGLLAAHFDLHENLFSWSRRWEALQLDEWPVAVFVFAVCLVALYAQRLWQLRRALRDNRRLAQKTIEVQEAERKHLARELHDELGQYLNAIKLDSQAIPAERPAELVIAAARRITGNADHVYAVVGDMIRRLRPAALDELGLVAALEACIDRWRMLQPSLQMKLTITGDFAELSDMQNLAVYRIVQEVLTNCVRHAAATQVHVRLARETDDAVSIAIIDNGRGMRMPPVDHAGNGLAGIRERVDLLGGAFEMLSGPGQGVTIRVQLPVNGESD